MGFFASTASGRGIRSARVFDLAIDVKDKIGLHTAASREDYCHSKLAKLNRAAGSFQRSENFPIRAERFEFRSRLFII